jgi:UDP-N-acetylmuramyl pentapeptide phosphotransferase/UDP-N-acetylglucosamine-1-phosphate transferase
VGTVSLIRSLGRAALGAAAAGLARAALRELRRSDLGPSLERVNHRGHTVSLASGPALAVAASAAAAAGATVEGQGRLAAAAAVAGLGAGAVGLYDDVVGARPEHKAKGFHGHLAALREGRVTSGMVKVAGAGAAGFLAAAMLPSRPRRDGRDRRGLSRAVDVVLGAGVIAGMANLMNLLDLRPGRAIKVGMLVGAPLADGPSGVVTAATLGAAGGLLPADLNEEVMLGDAGANALGALLGVAMAARTGPFARAVLLAGVAGLTATSERVSFTKVIAATPVLRDLDEWGRRPAGPITAPPAEPADGRE